MKINVVKAFSGVFQCCWENIICSFFPGRNKKFPSQPDKIGWCNHSDQPSYVCDYSLGEGRVLFFFFFFRFVNSTTKIIHFIFIAAQESITKELDELLTDLLGKKKTTEEVCACGVLDAIKECGRNKATMLAESSRTAALWIQYMNMIHILRSFIRA